MALTPGLIEILGLSPDEVLAHYGKLGMRWGVRNGEGTPTADKPAKKKPSADSERATELRKQAAKIGGIKTLSNDEIKELNKRLDLEQKYKDWRKKNPTLRDRAVKFIAKKLEEEGGKLLKDKLDKTGSLQDVMGELKKDFKKANPGPAPKVTTPKTHKPPSERLKALPSGGTTPKAKTRKTKSGKVYKITTL